MPLAKKKSTSELYRVILNYHDGEFETTCDTHNPHTAKRIYDHWKILNDESIEAGNRPWTVVLKQV